MFGAAGNVCVPERVSCCPFSMRVCVRITRQEHTRFLSFPPKLRVSMQAASVCDR